MFKRVICVCAVCLAVVAMLTGCAKNQNQATEPVPTEAYTAETVSAETLPVTPSVSETQSVVSGKSKGYANMFDYLADADVKKQFEDASSGFESTYKDMRFYALDESTVMFEYVFSQSYSGDTAERVKEALVGQESSLKYGAKTAIRSIAAETSISDPKVGYKYMDADGNVLYEHVFAAADVED